MSVVVIPTEIYLLLAPFSFCFGFNNCIFTVLTSAATASLFSEMGQAVPNQPNKPRHHHDCFLAGQEAK